MPPTLQSSVPFLGTALIAALAAQLATDGVTQAYVTDGPPAPDTIDTEAWVAVLDAEGAVSIQAMATRQPRDERYEQHLLISVVQSTVTDQASVTSRVYDIYASLETLLRNNPNLNGYYTGPGKLVSVVMGRFRLQRKAESESRGSELDLWLNVHARPQ